MAERKRVAIKHVRDKAKSAYDKQALCYICGVEEELELHHFNPLTRHFELWARKKKYKIETDEQVISIRDEYIEECHDVLYIDVVTLCSKHHTNLHRLYGKSPLLGTAKAQAKWVEKQRLKTLASE